MSGKKSDLNKPLRNKKIMFPKSGKGTICPKIGIPLSWVEALGITENEPFANVRFEDGEIKIKKEGV